MENKRVGGVKRRIEVSSATEVDWQPTQQVTGHERYMVDVGFDLRQRKGREHARGECGCEGAVGYVEEISLEK